MCTVGVPRGTGLGNTDLHYMCESVGVAKQAVM